MFANKYWKLFLETGMPEMYLMYKATKTEAENVSDGSSDRSQSNGLQ